MPPKRRRSSNEQNSSGKHQDAVEVNSNRSLENPENSERADAVAVADGSDSEEGESVGTGRDKLKTESETDELEAAELGTIIDQPQPRVLFPADNFLSPLVPFCLGTLFISLLMILSGVVERIDINYTTFSGLLYIIGGVFHDLFLPGFFAEWTARIVENPDVSMEETVAFAILFQFYVIHLVWALFKTWVAPVLW